MVQRIRPIRTGQAIKATRLNEYGDNINKLNDFATDSPRQNDDPGEAVLEAAAQSPSIYVEQSRIVSQVQVFDDEGTNYALIDRIDSIILVNGDGDTLELQFNN